MWCVKRFSSKEEALKALETMKNRSNNKNETEQRIEIEMLTATPCQPMDEEKKTERLDNPNKGKRKKNNKCIQY